MSTSDSQSELEQTLATASKHPDEATRYSAVDRLRWSIEDPRAIVALIQALGDPGYYEVPEPGAPPYVYGISRRAREILEPVARQHFTLLASSMESNPEIMLAGLEPLPHCGPGGVELLSKVADLNHKILPAAAARVIGYAIYKKVDEPLEPALRDILVRMLSHAQSSARSQAAEAIHSYCRDRPDLDPLTILPEGFLPVLAQKVRDGDNHTAAVTFIRSDLMLDVLVDGACRGGHSGDEAAYVLRVQQHRLTPAQISRLVRGKPTKNLLALWGSLGASEAIPVLLKLLKHDELRGAALTALLQIQPGAASLSLLAEVFMQDEDARSGIVAHHPQPEQLAAAVIPQLLEQWHEIAERNKLAGTTPYTIDLAPWRGMEALGPLMKGELPFLMTFLEPYGGWNTSRSYAVTVVGNLGAHAVPALPKLRVLLDHHDYRFGVLKALEKLGPVAGELFLPALRQMELESRNWMDRQATQWRQPALAALRSVSGGSEPLQD